MKECWTKEPEHFIIVFFTVLPEEEFIFPTQLRQIVQIIEHEGVEYFVVGPTKEDALTNPDEMFDQAFALNQKYTTQEIADKMGQYPQNPTGS